MLGIKSGLRVIGIYLGQNLQWRASITCVDDGYHGMSPTCLGMCLLPDFPLCRAQESPADKSRRISCI